MKRITKIHIKALVLLLIYMIGNVPVLLFHHHHTTFEPYSYYNSTACERTIYYPNCNDACHHQSHIHKVLDKCSFCDSHTIAQHILPTQLFVYFLQPEGQIYPFEATYFASLPPILLSNKGPPTV